MRILAIAQFEPEAPIQRVEATESREHAGKARKGDHGRASQRCRGCQRGPQQLAAEAREVGERAAQAGRRAPDEPRPGHPERLEDIDLEDHRDRLPGSFLEQGTQEVVAGVRIDPCPLGRADRRGALRSESRGVGEQVANRRSRWPERLVEGNRLALDRAEDGVGGHELRHGRPSGWRGRITDRCHDPVRTDHPDRGMVAAPVTDVSKRGLERTSWGDDASPPCKRAARRHGTVGLQFEVCNREAIRHVCEYRP